MLQNYPVSNAPSFNGPLEAQSRFLSLTIREREILFELVKVGNIKLVAKNLSISRFTVNQHLRSIYTKLGVKTKLEAVMFFLSYAHCQTKKDDRKKPEDIYCKARGGNGCDVMVCFLASFCSKEEFCMLDSKCSQSEPPINSKYITADKEAN
jgi:DNA-binding CsgD family transcriptional regulator